MDTYLAVLSIKQKDVTTKGNYHLKDDFNFGFRMLLTIFGATLVRLFNKGW